MAEEHVEMNVLTGQALEQAEEEDDTTSSKVAVGGSDPDMGGASTSKVFVVQKVSPIWDPLCSPDWDKESHSKEALLRIKRYRDSCLQVCYIK